MISALKKMNVEGFSNAWNLSCEDCSSRLNVFRKKKVCFFCKNSFCQVCIMRREDKKLCCRKCQILTARPLNRKELLNLKSRDLINYLTSKHISTNGCFEKEDLVNVLMRAVNNSCFHPSSSTNADNGSCTNSNPNSPRSNVYSTERSNVERNLSHSIENLFNEDGIRITGYNSAENTYSSERSNPEINRSNSIENLLNGDGIRIMGYNTAENSYLTPRSNREINQSDSIENLVNEDGIRIIGYNTAENSYSTERSNHENDQSNTTEISFIEDGIRITGFNVNFVQGDHSILDEHGDVGEGVMANLENATHSSYLQDDLSNRSTENYENAGDFANNDVKDHESAPLKLSDIKCKADLDNLSVKQLKQLLMRNNTDIKGCIERVELIQRAKRLWSDYTVSRKDLENLSFDELCKICMDAPIECVLLECGHMATCTSCGKQLCECPICRQYVVRCVRTFKA